MRSPLRRSVLLLAGFALLGSACRDGGSPTGVPGRNEARVGFSLNVAGTSVRTISVEVTAPDIAGRLAFNIEAVNGVATGSITIPAGSGRTITARAYDAKGILTHEGSRVVTVRGGTNTSITLSLVPTAGDQPLTISFGALVVQVSRAVAPPSYPEFNGDNVGDTVRYNAVVQFADGTPANGKVRWASLNPAIATVDSTGLVTARRPGQVEIAATYLGVPGAATFTVRGDGTDGSADLTPPKVTGITFSPDSIDIAAGDTVVTVTVKATDAGKCVQSFELFLSAPLVSRNERDFQIRSCSASDWDFPDEPTNEVTWTCRIAFSPHHAAGMWSMHMRINDRGGNDRTIDADELAARGIDTSLEVVNANGDVTGPAVTNISVAPDSINLTTATDTVVTVTVSASDPGAGVDKLEITFRSESGYHTPNCQTTVRSLPPGTPTNQVTLDCKIPLRRTLPAGTYTLSNMLVRDAVGNATSVARWEITAAGWEYTFKVAK